MAGPPLERAAPGEATRRFAEDLLDLRLKAPDATAASDLLLDHLGIAVGAERYPWVRALREYGQCYAGAGRSLVIGRPWRTSAEISALINGVAGHSFELDDTHEPSMSHPGAVIFPTVVALAAECDVSGLELLTAAACGYEAMARLGSAVGAAAAIAKGWHPTALFGVFGAAAAAARLRRLEPDLLVTAWGHALSQAGGSMQFSQEPAGADVKRLHAGSAARNGLFAIEMARRGVTAPQEAFEGRYGVLALFGAAAPQALVTRPTTLALREVSLKPYACNRLLHAVIDALDALTGFEIPHASVTRVTVRGPRKLTEQHMLRRPETPMAAQYSLPFTVGAAMAYGPHALEAYDPGRLQDRDILAWADLVQVEIDAELEARFPGQYGAEVILSLASGEIRRVRVADALGAPRRPLPRAAIQAKARSLATRAAPAEAFARVEAAVAGLSSASSAGSLLQALAALGDGEWT